MKEMRIVLLGLALLALVVGCSHDEEILAPLSSTPEIVYTVTADKNGTETLGAPSIAIAAGSGFAEGGVGMVDVTSGTLTIDVPEGAAVAQALLYWAGGTTGAPGDDTIVVDGTEILGELIGGPVNFFSVDGVQYYFSSFRADITRLGLVSAGANSFTITGFDFDYTGSFVDENNGVSLLVIYDDGTEAEIGLVDGLDMAFFNFVPTLDATVPQTFAFTADAADRTADLVIMAGSVGEGRPNQIKVTTSAGDQFFTDVLGSFEGLLWDSMILPVLVPAGDTSLTVQLISTPNADPLGASLGWVGAGLSVPTVVVEELGCRVTGGAHGTFEADDRTELYNFGGQATPQQESHPQPWGNWIHHQESGTSGSFLFHAGTPSSPAGTEIARISCTDPGWCVPAHIGPTKQIDFGGVGTFKNIRNAPASIADHVVVGETYHWFEVNIDDLGEPGDSIAPDECDPLGFGVNGGTDLAECDCPDFYRIRIYEGSTDASAVMYEVFGYIDNGNLQIHPLIGRVRTIWQ